MLIQHSSEHDSEKLGEYTWEMQMIFRSRGPMGFVMQLFAIRISTLLHHADPTLTIRNISRALAEVTDYHGLGIQLGLPLHELNTIEANHQRVKRRKMEVLALWLQGPDPEWKDLILALNLRRSARKLQEAIQKGEYQGIWSKRVISYCATMRAPVGIHE